MSRSMYNRGQYRPTPQGGRSSTFKYNGNRRDNAAVLSGRSLLNESLRYRKLQMKKRTRLQKQFPSIAPARKDILSNRINKLNYLIKNSFLDERARLVETLNDANESNKEIILSEIEFLGNKAEQIKVYKNRKGLYISEGAGASKCKETETSSDTSIRKDIQKYYKETAFGQHLIDDFTNGSLVGVEFVVEVREDVNARFVGNCTYLCGLCGLKLTPENLTAHITSIPHKVKFTEILYPELFAKSGNYKIWEPEQLQEFCDALKKVEETIGRKKLAVCLGKDRINVLNLLKNIKEQSRQKCVFNSSKSSRSPEHRPSKSRTKRSPPRSSRRNEPSGHRPTSPIMVDECSDQTSSNSSFIDLTSAEKSLRNKFACERNTDISNITRRPSSPVSKRKSGNSRTSSPTVRYRSHSPNNRKSSSHRRYSGHGRLNVHSHMESKAQSSRSRSSNIRRSAPYRSKSRSPMHRSKPSTSLRSRSPLIRSPPKESTSPDEDELPTSFTGRQSQLNVLKNGKYINTQQRNNTPKSRNGTSINSCVPKRKYVVSMPTVENTMLYGIAINQVAREICNMSESDGLEYVTNLLYDKGFTNPDSGESIAVLKAVGTLRLTEECTGSSNLVKKAGLLPTPSSFTSDDTDKTNTTSTFSKDYNKYDIINSMDKSTFNPSINMSLVNTVSFDGNEQQLEKIMERQRNIDGSNHQYNKNVQHDLTAFPSHVEQTSQRQSEHSQTYGEEDSYLQSMNHSTFRTERTFIENENRLDPHFTENLPRLCEINPNKVMYVKNYRDHSLMGPIVDNNKDKWESTREQMSNQNKTGYYNSLSDKNLNSGHNQSNSPHLDDGSNGNGLNRTDPQDHDYNLDLSHGNDNSNSAHGKESSYLNTRYNSSYSAHQNNNSYLNTRYSSNSPYQEENSFLNHNSSNAPHTNEASNFNTRHNKSNSPHMQHRNDQTNSLKQNYTSTLIHDYNRNCSPQRDYNLKLNNTAHPTSGDANYSQESNRREVGIDGTHKLQYNYVNENECFDSMNRKKVPICNEQNSSCSQVNESLINNFENKSESFDENVTEGYGWKLFCKNPKQSNEGWFEFGKKSKL